MSAASLDAVFSSLLARRRDKGVLRRLTTAGTGLVDFSSNDYLSLSRNPELRREYLSRLQDRQASTFRLGSGGSRLLDGNSALAESLENDLAAFHRAGAALLFNSGYEANTGLLACVPRPGDVVVLDEYVHASVHAGVNLSRVGKAAVWKFGHNNVWETRAGSRDRTVGEAPNTSSLEGVLGGITDGEQGREISEGRSHVFLAVEAVYSMDGDLAPLHDIVRCVEQYLPLGNGHVIVDEAHSNGLFGDRGKGLVCDLGLEDRVWARVQTFGKALGCSGAAILCSPITRDYLINYARTFIYTTAMGFPGLANVQVAYEFIASGRADPSRAKLRGLIRQLGARLTRLCSGASPTFIRVNPLSGSLAAQSPIIPVFTSRARSLAEHCQGKGFMVRAIVAPTVPWGTDRVRICLHAGNTVEECRGLCDAIEEWVSGQVGAETQVACPPRPAWAGYEVKHRL